MYTPDPNEISNVLHVNTHFSKIEPSLASEFHDNSSRFIDYITPTDKIFNLTEVSYQEIQYIQSRKNRLTKRVALTIFLHVY